jgi:hypothetical protein
MPETVANEYINASNTNSTQPVGFGGIDPKLLEQQLMWRNNAAKFYEDKLKQQKEEAKSEEEIKKLQDKTRSERKALSEKELKDVEEEKKRQEDIAKKQKEIDDSRKNELKSAKTETIVPDNKKPTEENKPQSTGDSFFDRFKSYIKLLPQQVQQPKKQADGEQMDIGEKVLRVSFHPEGIKILKTLLEPIYVALKASTKLLNDELKEIIEKMDMFGTKSSGLLGKLLALGLIGFLSDLVKAGELLGKTFKWLVDIPNKLKAILEDEGLYKLADYKAWLELRWEKYVSKPWNKLIESLNLEKPIARITAQIENLQKALKLDELGIWIELYFEQYVVNPIKTSFNSLKNFGESVKNFFSDNIVEPIAKSINRLKEIGSGLADFFEPWIRPFKEIGKLFGEGEGFLSRFMKPLQTFFNFVKGFEGPFMRVLSVLKPFVSVLEFLGRIISVEFIALISGVIDAVRTFFDVWKDDKLSFIQKAVSVVAGFIGGLGSMVGDFVKMIGEAVSYLGKFIPGLSFVGKGIESFGKVLDTHDLGKNVANMFREYNDSGSGKETFDVRNSEKYKNASPEERKKMEENFAQAQHKGQHFVRQGKAGGMWVNDTVTNPETKPQPKPAEPPIAANDKNSQPAYQPAPIEGSQAQMSKATDVLLENQKKMNIQFMTALDRITNKMLDANKSPTIINQSSTTTMPRESGKEYLLKPVYDISTEKRSDWWKMSRQYDPNN